MKPLWWMTGRIDPSNRIAARYLLNVEGDPNPDPGGGAPAFDPAAFKTELLGEFNKGLNGLAKQIKALAKSAPSGDPNPDPDPNPNPNPNPAPSDGTTKALERKLKALEDQVAQANQRGEQETARRRNAERDSQVSKLLKGYAFVDDEAANDAFELIAPKLKWSEDGESLLAPDGETTAEEWVKTVMGKKAHLLAPKDVGGAGARKGGGAGNRKFTLEDIDNMKNLSAEDQAKLRSEVAATMGNAMSGR